MKLIDISSPNFPNTFSKVSDNDFEFLNQWKWYARTHKGRTYCMRHRRANEQFTKSSVVTMHQLLMGFPKGLSIDHINGDGLDNRRENLRLCTAAQNQWNVPKRFGASRFKGVSYDKKSKKFRAYIRLHGVRKHLGTFLTDIEAAMKYNEIAKVSHGEFANLNQIPEPSAPLDAVSGDKNEKGGEA